MNSSKKVKYRGATYVRVGKNYGDLSREEQDHLAELHDEVTYAENRFFSTLQRHLSSEKDFETAKKELQKYSDRYFGG